ncbi:carboxypeptidase-like regulatory domain-containing protein [Sinomicrobium weinanense]|uniref:TonB-dependent receptor plug domain-containing protein n=1 Tax=Sinomicrobium weinanense TaxID=2842200 RepID=A0A926Q3W4_9FLAO|nr:carboxypeptidase-like regulatory domain-containing protein [Sinomicrobium weinanense]MBC9797349.1 TonB-dependent receptor plug domain-containing protein [Sinomicrobium weinanense]MBU3124529.1 TonB-dependent receptor plug domain-containing protein [Sinomicrobium weinanense]
MKNKTKWLTLLLRKGGYLLVALLQTAVLFAGDGNNSGKQDQTRQEGIQIKGQVTSADDGMPLPGVSVLLKGSAIGTVTDLDGHYEIEVPDEQSVLVFTYIGFAQAEEVVGSRTTVDIAMREDVQQLENVVVTALGIKREEKKLGYSVQRIDGEDVQKVKTVDVATALTGKVAGLWIQNSTEFDQAPDIRLRGGSSNPLLVVDGIPYGNMSLREIASDDIESMDVLKGATASALYGSRGSGGAIIITTKSGGNGISVNSNNMMFAGYLALPKVQHSYSAGIGGEYNSIDYVWGNKLDAGVMREQWNPETKQMEEMELTSRGRNNFKNFLEPGFIANNNISFARSGDIGSIRTSLTHVYNKGQYPNLRLNRLNANVVGKLKLGDDFELQGNVGYNRSTAPQTTGAGYGDQGFIYQILMWTGPEYDLKKYRDYWVVPDQQQNWHYKAWYDNPYLIAYEKLNGVERNMTNINLTSTYKPFSGAKITARVGYDFYSDETTRRTLPGLIPPVGGTPTVCLAKTRARGIA